MTTPHSGAGMTKEVAHLLDAFWADYVEARADVAYQRDELLSAIVCNRNSDHLWLADEKVRRAEVKQDRCWEQYIRAVQRWKFTELLDRIAQLTEAK